MSNRLSGYDQRRQRTAWFRDARFGMFIHWGLYAIPARGEWVRSAEQMSIEDYQPYFDRFNPVAFDPAAWARQAKRAGMRYAVLTAKHHDGFCLFDSSLTDYKATCTPAGRDLVREFVEAFRAENLKVGLYYSLPDWHHPDYPAWGDRQHPMRSNPEYRDKKHDWSNYVDYLHGQVRELCVNYGRLDIMWFDFSYWDKRGDAWRANELVRMVRSLQPDVLIDNRLGGSMEKAEPDEFAGDFHGPEQGVPRNGCQDELGRPLAWEACITLNNSWGYSAGDHEWKTPATVIRTLVNCASKDGNLLVNVGPDARGVIPLRATEILDEVGKWLAANGEAIYGCGPDARPRPEWGRWTRKGNLLYAHVMEQMIGHIALPGLRDQVKFARRVADEAEVILTDFWNQEVDSFDEPEDVFMAFRRPVMCTWPLPDPTNTVVRLELE